VAARPAQPGRAAADPAVRDRARQLSRRFDRLILDSPPIQAVTDAVVLSKRVDGTILVVRASKTMRDDLRRSARMVATSAVRSSASSSNELDARDSYYGGYGYGGYSYGRYGRYYSREAEDKAGDDDA